MRFGGRGGEGGGEGIDDGRMDEMAGSMEARLCMSSRHQSEMEE